MTHQPRHDRFTLPTLRDGDETPALRQAQGSVSSPPQDERACPQSAHQLAHPEEAPRGAVSKGHGEEGLSSSRSERSERPSRTTHPAGRGWVPLSRDLGIPAEHATDDPLGAAGHSAVFTLERRIRFLDHLALKGNVRAAAARVGVSHETAYRKRRQDADFAALWDAAMVHARAYAEAVLATRALDGVEVPISYHGEITGYEIHHDTRLLLAHLARLDRKLAEEPHAAARAGRFDELLAAYAGHEEPEGFAEAAEEALDRQDRADAPPLPPARQDYVTFRRGEAMGGADADEEAEAMAEAAEAAGEEWDDWHRSAVERVCAIVEQAEEPASPLAGEAPHSPLPLAGGAGGGPVKTPPTPSNIPSREPVPSEPRRREGGQAPTPRHEGNSSPGNRVTSVNPAAPCPSSQSA